MGVEYGKAKAAHELILDMRFFPSETLKAVSWIFCYCVRPQDRAGIGAKANAPLLLTCSSQMQCRAPCTLLCLNLEKIWNKRCTKSPSTYNTIAILGDYCNRQACTSVFGGLLRSPNTTGASLNQSAVNLKPVFIWVTCTSCVKDEKVLIPKIFNVIKLLI